MEESKQENELEELAAEYLEAKEGGSAMPLADFMEARVPAERRAEFKDLVQAALSVQDALPRPLGAGSRLAGRYRIIEEIGRGGMGKVFRAFDETLQRPVAVKVLGSLQQGDEEQEALLMKESRLLAGLQHPNIVAIHEAGRDENVTFLVMDLVDGTSLSQVIESARATLQRRHGAASLSPKKGDLLTESIGKEVPTGRKDFVDERSWYESVARIALEIARTLEAAHGHEIVHRDLKPNNIMLLGGGNPVVLDFGLAGSSSNAAEVTDGLYGTVAYLAPEQARTHQVGNDPRTDVYQLGLVLYEMLTLQRAFPGEGIGPVMMNIKNGLFRAPRKLNPAAPRELEAICLKAMELSPDKRYPTALELRQDLERYVQGAAPLAMRSDRARAAVRNTRYFVRKHPATASLTGMAASAALVAGISSVVLAASSWVDVSLYKHRAGADKVTELSLKKREVQIGDTLGARIRNRKDEAWVYALSVMRNAEGESLVAPMNPFFLEEMRRGEQPRRQGDWDLRIEKGVNYVACTDIVSDENDYEGLLVIVSEKVDDVLEQWLDNVDDAVERSLVGGIPRDVAMDMLLNTAHGEVARGGKLGVLTPEERERYSNLPTHMTDESWEQDTMVGSFVECRVVK